MEVTRLREKVMLALASLPARNGATADERERAVVTCTDQIVVLFGGESGNGKAFREASETESHKEITALSRAAAKLLVAIENLHGPSIDALANLGVMRDPLREELPKVVRAKSHPSLSKLLAGTKDPGGKAVDQRAHAIATFLAHS